MGTKKVNKNKKTVVKNTTKKPKLNQTISKKLKAKKAPTPVEKKITFGCLIVLIIVVIVSLFVGFFFNPERVAERKLAALAKDYYENYFYENFSETIERDDKAEAFKKYEETGFAPVYLRQLLLFDNERNASFEKYFKNDRYSCDRSKTKVQFFPVEPYGKKDYTVEYTFSCNYE